jgi:hypothetical protein
MRLGKYVKAAFLNHWNLLALFGGSAFALISGRPDVLLPVVAAVEIAYLGLLGTHPKFQRYIEVQEAAAARKANTVDSQQALHRIIKALPKELLDRFLALRTRCLELQQIALELKHPGELDAKLRLDEFQTAGLDRLLWIHLRLLFTANALERFLRKTSEDQIHRDIQRLEKQLAQLTDGADANRIVRIRKALEDNLQTSRARLENLAKARDNYELVKLEIDRLENKIRSLSELAVNRQEPDYISAQVDQVAASMLDTERTMNELRFATGLEIVDEAPELLRAKNLQTQ